MKSWQILLCLAASARAFLPSVPRTVARAPIAQHAASEAKADDAQGSVAALKELRDAGIISGREYERKKAKALGTNAEKAYEDGFAAGRAAARAERGPFAACLPKAQTAAEAAEAKAAAEAAAAEAAAEREQERNALRAAASPEAERGSAPASPSRMGVQDEHGSAAAMVQQHSGNAAGPQPEVQEAEADADNGGRVTPVYGGSSNAAVDDANRSGSCTCSSK